MSHKINQNRHEMRNGTEIRTNFMPTVSDFLQVFASFLAKFNLWCVASQTAAEFAVSVYLALELMWTKLMWVGVMETSFCCVILHTAVQKMAQTGCEFLLGWDRQCKVKCLAGSGCTLASSLHNKRTDWPEGMSLPHPPPLPFPLSLCLSLSLLTSSVLNSTHK